MGLLTFTGRKESGLDADSQQGYIDGEHAARDETVLIVDDSRTMVHALAKFFQDAGFGTLAAYDGVQALAQARSNLPDIIIMDIVMPNMNGFEATRILTRDPATAHIPVIIVSGSERPTDRMWGARQGAKGYLAKPFRKSLLLNTINEVLARTRTRPAAAQIPTLRRQVASYSALKSA